MAAGDSFEKARTMTRAQDSRLTRQHTHYKRSEKSFHIKTTSYVPIKGARLQSKDVAEACEGERQIEVEVERTLLRRSAQGRQQQ